MPRGLEIGFSLDRRWHWLKGEMETSKKPALLALARVLADAKVPYAVIRGVAMQVRQDEPRTTLDIDVAVLERAALPRSGLETAGFRETGRHAHSDNWVGPEGTPVQFTDDPALSGAVLAAEELTVDGVPLRIARAADLLSAKLRAAADPARRRSKPLVDLADAQALIERDPALEQLLSEADRALLLRLS
jgi:hypothetical protein